MKQKCLVDEAKKKCKCERCNLSRYFRAMSIQLEIQKILFEALSQDSAFKPKPKIKTSKRCKKGKIKRKWNKKIKKKDQARRTQKKKIKNILTRRWENEEKNI